MANLVKSKVAITGVSLFLLTLIPLLDSSFLRSVVKKRWSKLSWEDFQGIPKPWSKFDAGINSGIYLEYDSTLKRFRAYSAQDNIKSWVKSNYEPQDPDYLLNHEQYHFNITETFARSVDGSITDNSEDEEYLHRMRVMNGNSDLAKMQSNYDTETNHGTILHRQRRWEFKIDSLLRGEDGWLVDYYSGASIFLPIEIKTSATKWIANDDTRSRSYQENAWGITFDMMSMQYPGGYGDSIIHRIAKNSLEREKTVLLSIDSESHARWANFYKQDSTGLRRYFTWTYEDQKLFFISSSFFMVQGDTAGYYEIAKSVMNSFRVRETGTLWRDVEASTVTGISSIGKKQATEDRYNFCMVSGNHDPIGFVSDPVFFDDGSVQFSCDFSAVADSLRFKDFVAIDRATFIEYKPKDVQTFYIPSTRLNDVESVEVGYVLKEDTAQRCFQTYSEIVNLRRGVNRD